MAEEFKYLFTPFKVGSMTVPNRILSTPHVTGLSELDGLPGPRQIAYWEAKARGGVGLIGTQAFPVHYSHGAMLVPFVNEEFVPRWKKCVDVIHQYGSKITVQLWHAGRQGSGGGTGRPIWAPSQTTVRTSYEPPHAMTEDEIWEVIRAYAHAAVMSREAGIDGVEIHSAHGYLPQQFMSPLSNLRDDKWGGSWENRLRFLLETISAVREAVGKDYPVGIRLTADEFLDGGYTVEDMKTLAPIIAGTGNLDFISVSSGNYASYSVLFPPMYYPLGAFVYLAAAVKSVVDLPIYCVGRINDPVQAEKILADNQADIIGMNRATIADPEMPRKAREGRLEEIRKCIACNEGCIGRLARGAPMSCALNPVTGQEREWLEIQPAATKKKVVIVGGGVAGLETARVAALRGHRVSLIERGSELGGQVNIAAKAPGRQDFGEVTRYYTYQMKLLGVEVMLNTEATAESVLSMEPDAVVVATGSKPNKPRVPGMDQPNVVHVRDVLTGKAAVGDNVLVVALEHHTIGATCADFLATQRKKVEIINEELAIGSKIELNTQLVVHQRLATGGVTLSASTGLRSVDGNTVTVYNVFSGVERKIEGIDTVVIASIGEADSSLATALRGRVKECFLIGQANSPRRMYECIYDGAELGRAI